MDYHVILIEYGKPTHHWTYCCLESAIAQLTRLLEAYIEVNEVSATIIKAGYPERDYSPYQLIQEQISCHDRSELG